MNTKLFLAVILFIVVNIELDARPFNSSPINDDRWQLIWNDEFDYPDVNLDADWNSANGYQPGLLCSRWRKNAEVSNGTLKLKNIKETLAGQEWTSASIWTKRQFQYGYFECRYRYAAATGTNNSFWMMSSIRNPEVGKQFEIDINEGHYPNELNTNLHNWTDVEVVDGVTTHPSFSQSFILSNVKPDYSIVLEVPISTNKIRLFSTHSAHFHIPEFRIYNVNSKGYPETMSATADNDFDGLVNFARDAETIISASGIYSANYPATYAADGLINRHWVSQATGDKWIQFEFTSKKTIGCIQFINGWLSNGEWRDLLENFKVQYFDGDKWVDIKTYNILDEFDLSRDFHTYGLEWNENELIYYFDNKELRRLPNTFCFSPASIYLSEAILTWAGPVTDAIDGTQMEVDYVRVYNLIPENTIKNYIFNGGFENPSNTYDWKYLKESGNLSTYSLIRTDPVEGLISLRINAKSSSNPYGTYLTQKIALKEGQYELKFYSRAINTSAENSKFQFKFINDITGASLLMNDVQTDKIVNIDSQWKSYKYTIDLKEDYSGKIVFGFAHQGTFDLDSVSLIRIGDVLSSSPSINQSSDDIIKVVGNHVLIKSQDKTNIEIFKSDGRLILSKKLDTGLNSEVLNDSGVYIVRLRKNNNIVTKKIIIYK